MSLSEYVKAHIAALIADISQESARTARDTSDDAVHDLRVAIRKLSESLKVFQDFFPGGAAKTVRGDLRLAMRMAGDVRNHDIARKLMEKAKIPGKRDIAAGRAQAAMKLSSALSGWNQGATFRAWREQLHV